MDKRRHSGFARFADTRARDRFVERVLQRDASLKARAYLSATQPTIVFEALSDAEQQRVVRAVQEDGKWFGDVQFDPMR